jgi:sodium/proline symporter
VRPIGGIWNIYELLPAFIVALIVNVAVSLSTPAPEQEVTAVFDSLQAGKDAN